MLKYTNIKSGDIMTKNKEILNNWKKEVKEKNKLNLEQAQSLYKKIIECKDESLKRQLRHKLINETSYVICNCIENAGYEYFNSYSLDMNDIINAALEEWIKRLDSGEILKVNFFSNLLTHNFYTEVAKNLGINIDIDSKDYLCRINEFTNLIHDYINKNKQNINYNYLDLVNEMKDNSSYPHLERTIIHYEEDLVKNQNIVSSKYLEKHIEEYDMSTFELFDGIIKSLDIDNINISKTSMYDLKNFILYIGQEHSRKNIDNITYDNVEKISEKREIKRILRDLIDNCTGVDDIHKKVIYERYGFDEEPATLESIGKKYGHNKEYIRQREGFILRKLRHPSRSKRIKEFY